jgi:D-arabinose 1-dehydrogenase-like Zn-dependent alcohol dehydrogenase
VKPPFDAGFESLGVVAAVGSQVSGVKVGTPVTSTGTIIIVIIILFAH